LQLFVGADTTYVCVSHFKLNWALMVIQGHPYWCQQKSRTGCYRNAQ